MAVETRLLAKRFAVRRIAGTVETILQSLFSGSYDFSSIRGRVR